MKKIKIRKLNRYLILDNEDYEILKKQGYKFVVLGRKENPYIYAEKRIILHKLILEAPEGREVDHINRNKLDNRRKNLRIVTRSQNQWNKGKYRNNTSGFQGVSWRKDRKRWKAKLSVYGKIIFSRLFKTKREAFIAYKQAKAVYHI